MDDLYYDDANFNHIVNDQPSYSATTERTDTTGAPLKKDDCLIYYHIEKASRRVRSDHEDENRALTCLPCPRNP